MKKFFFGFLILISLVVYFPSSSHAELQVNKSNDGEFLAKSLESLRDLEYQSWKVVVYRNSPIEKDIIIRIVGFPGSVRLDHPTFLKVKSGRRSWELEDKTLLNSKLANDTRQAAAEFNIRPLLDDLTNNRPLRLQLDGVFNELPIPPYLVAEWRQLVNDLTTK